VKYIQEAQRIELSKKQSIAYLTLDWTGGSKRFIEDMELLRELTPPSSLEKIVIQGYNSSSFPQWLSSISIYLPNLVSVTLKGLSQCSSLPPLGQLPNLIELVLEAMPSITKMDTGFWGANMKAYPRLGSLTISEMENLEEWSVTCSCDDGIRDEFMFPNLKTLLIRRCHKLRVGGPCPPRVNTLSIVDSNEVLMQWEEGPPHTVYSTSSAPVVRTLKVAECMVPMHQWKLLHQLPALTELSIDSCDDLTSSAEVTQALAPLRKLSLSCTQELPQWLGDLTSLRSLKLEKCQDIQGLPECLGGGLFLLKKLKIWRCQGITPLLESLGQRRYSYSIDRIEFWSCPELSKWCELELHLIKNYRITVRYRLTHVGPDSMKLHYLIRD